MASGDNVVEVIRDIPPGANAAAPAQRTGGSTPAEGVTVWAFDASTIEYMDFLCRLRGYDGGGLSFSHPWSGASATTGVVRWGIAIRRLQDDAEDIDTSQTYDFNDADDTVASVSGELSYPTITFTDGADMDNWADGELAIVRVRRNASHANDTMTGDAELWDLEGTEI
jgi:hypothetical protein